ncbi:stationary-phase survival protein SurE [Thermotoga petrophila RKU-10]|uniref:5'-nucleotidase SurE n=1 Tax=Thermotoga petrophila (strain ATCC BAA-489 / DSM 13996 / JCM 10882 / RKU-10) TaxID=590168 RepID=D2C8E4_THEP2|nr:5'/3'-nucleotidase SurE [Thermotoga petrophila]ADA67230.1 stationary-phase survival protein SurE [Thermotoga petrophila RKU-10]
MRILVTNDDGIQSKGIIVLAELLSEEHEVFVVAPDKERSATGHSITIHVPLWMKKVFISERVVAYSTTGTPADCVKLAYNVIMDKRVDLIVSGVNRGPNMGMDILYSGTVSGAMEGAMMNIPSIAISSANYESPDFEGAARFLIDFLKEFDFSLLDPFTMLNINVPAGEIKGWRFTRQSRRRWNDYFEERVSPFGEKYYWMMGEVIEDDDRDDVDYKAVREGYVSITPIHPFLTNEQCLKKLREVYD